MRNFEPGSKPHYCRCGALREASKIRCRKCHYRRRWNRRKAWRINPLRQNRRTVSTFNKEVSAP